MRCSCVTGIVHRNIRIWRFPSLSGGREKKKNKETKKNKKTVRFREQRRRDEGSNLRPREDYLPWQGCWRGGGYIYPTWATILLRSYAFLIPNVFRSLLHPLLVFVANTHARGDTGKAWNLWHVNEETVEKVTKPLIIYILSRWDE